VYIPSLPKAVSACFVVDKEIQNISQIHWQNKK